jgi:O-acetyl-ADP-ribose deacetylase (regulator of RNase III)
MKIIKGDIIKLAQQGQFDVIVHGCNCFCTMGSGIAKAVKSCFPIAFQVDLKTQKGEKAKLGTYSSATVEMLIRNSIGEATEEKLIMMLSAKYLANLKVIIQERELAFHVLALVWLEVNGL